MRQPDDFSEHEHTIFLLEKEIEKWRADYTEIHEQLQPLADMVADEINLSTPIRGVPDPQRISTAVQKHLSTLQSSLTKMERKLNEEICKVCGIRGAWIENGDAVKDLCAYCQLRDENEILQGKLNGEKQLRQAEALENKKYVELSKKIHIDRDKEFIEKYTNLQADVEHLKKETVALTKLWEEETAEKLQAEAKTC